MLKKLVFVVCAVLICTIIPSSVLADASYPKVTIIDNGQPANVSAVLFKDRTMVKLRDIAALMEYDVSWDAATNSAKMSDDSKTVTFFSDSYAVDGHQVDMYPYPNPVIIAGRLYVPLRVIEATTDLTVSGWNGSQRAVSITRMPENDITITNKQEISKAEQFDARKDIDTSIQYPQLANTDADAALDKINATISSTVADIKSSVQKSFEEHAKSITDDIIKSLPDARNTLTLDYNIMYNKSGLLSIKFTRYQYFIGSAHGDSFVKCLTFDLNTGNVLTLKDLFKSDTDYTSMLSKNVIAQIKDSKTESNYTNVDSITVDADQQFYIDHEALTVIFQPYEIGPRTIGAPEFHVNYKAISDSMDTELYNRIIGAVAS